MTDRIAIGLALVLLAAIGLDIYANDSHALLFALRKFAGLVEYVSFWR